MIRSFSESVEALEESWGNLKGLPKALLDTLSRDNSYMNDPVGPKSTFTHFPKGGKDYLSISNKVMELLAAEHSILAAVFGFTRKKWILFEILEEDDLDPSNFRNSTDVYLISSSPEEWSKHNERKYGPPLDDYEGGAVGKDKALTYVRSTGIPRGAFTTFNGGRRVRFQDLLSASKSRKGIIRVLIESWGNLKGLPKELLDTLKAVKNSAVGPKSTLTHFPLGGEDVPSILDKLRELLVTEHAVHAAIFLNKKWITIYNVVEDDLDPGNLQYCTDAYLIGSPLELRRKHIRRGFVTHDDYEGGAVGTDKAMSYARSAGILRGPLSTFNQGKRTRFKSLLSASKSRKDINESWGNLKGLPEGALKAIKDYNQDHMSVVGPSATYRKISPKIGIKKLTSQMDGNGLNLIVYEDHPFGGFRQWFAEDWDECPVPKNCKTLQCIFPSAEEFYLCTVSEKEIHRIRDRNHSSYSAHDSLRGGTISSVNARLYARTAAKDVDTFDAKTLRSYSPVYPTRISWKTMLALSAERRLNESWGNLKTLPKDLLNRIKSFNDSADYAHCLGPKTTVETFPSRSLSMVSIKNRVAQLMATHHVVVVSMKRESGWWVMSVVDDVEDLESNERLGLSDIVSDIYIFSTPQEVWTKLLKRPYDPLHSARDDYDGGSVGRFNAQTYIRAKGIKGHFTYFNQKLRLPFQDLRHAAALRKKESLNESWGNLKGLPKDLLDKIRADKQTLYRTTHDTAVTFFPYSSTSFKQLSAALKQYQEAGGPYNSFSKVALKGDGQSWSFHPTTRSLGPMIDKGKCDVYWFVTPAASGRKHYERTRAAERRLDDYDGGAISADLATTYVLNATNRSSSHQRLLSLKDHPTKGPHIMDLQTGGYMKTFNNGARIRLRDMRFEHEQFGNLNESWGNLKGLPKALLDEIRDANRKASDGYMFSIVPESTVWFFPVAPGSSREALLMFRKLLNGMVTHYLVAAHKHLFGWVLHYNLMSLKDALNDTPGDIYILKVPFEGGDKHYSRHYSNKVVDDYQGGSVSADLASTYARNAGQKLNAGYKEDKGSFFHQEPTFNNKRRVAISTLRSLKSFTEHADLSESFGQGLQHIPNDLKKAIANHNQHVKSERMWSGLQITAHSTYDIMTNQEAQREWNLSDLLSSYRAMFFCVFFAGTWLVFPKTHGSAPHLMPSEGDVYVIYVDNVKRAVEKNQRKEQRKVQDPYDATFREKPTGTLKLADVNMMLKLRGGRPIPPETRDRYVVSGETQRVATHKASEWLRLQRK